MFKFLLLFLIGLAPAKMFGIFQLMMMLTRLATVLTITWDVAQFKRLD